MEKEISDIEGFQTVFCQGRSSVHVVGALPYPLIVECKLSPSWND